MNLRIENVLKEKMAIEPRCDILYMKSKQNLPGSYHIKFRFAHSFDLFGSMKMRRKNDSKYLWVIYVGNKICCEITSLIVNRIFCCHVF